MKLLLKGIRDLELIQGEGPSVEAPRGAADVTVLACAVCRTDAKMWDQGHRDLVFPRVMGHEMVVRAPSGGRCIVWPGKSCGGCRYCRSGRENLCDDMKITGFHNDGGFASRVVVPEKSLIPIPDELDTHIACFGEPVGCVINALEKISVTPGSRVLIYGAGTMGLITALYVQHLGLVPVLIEKNARKIDRIEEFLERANIRCVKETFESEFDVVINSCGDYIALAQGIAKAAKGGRLSFFSGITKNEHIETNLLNLIHYKEMEVTGAYGLKKADMEKAVPFLISHTRFLKLLIEKVVSPGEGLGVIPGVLTGNHLKYILDFSMVKEAAEAKVRPGAETDAVEMADYFKPGSPGRATLEAITPLPETLLTEAADRIDNKTKPLGALGRLEPLAVQMSRIQGSLTPEIHRKKMFVFAGDHGVTEEGVSAYPSEVTAQMVENFLNGGAAINVLCRHHDIDMKVVDMGVNYDFKPHENLIGKKTAYGTRNFALEDAMSREEMLTALESGMDVFLDGHESQKVDIVGLGEMGIGNTTSSSAIIAAVTGISPAQAVGRGTGVDDKGLEHKTEVIEKVLAFHKVDSTDGFALLQKIGGFEIAGIAGAVLAAASKQCAVVLDGVISTAAGLIAYLINPHIQGYLISGHKSVEVSQEAALAFMGLEPVIDLNMRLGEGTGAALAIDMADAACRIMCEMASFDEAKIARSNLKG